MYRTLEDLTTCYTYRCDNNKFWWYAFIKKKGVDFSNFRIYYKETRICYHIASMISQSTAYKENLCGQDISRDRIAKRNCTKSQKDQYQQTVWNYMQPYLSQHTTEANVGSHIKITMDMRRRSLPYLGSLLLENKEEEQQLK